jgi:hypothetical protein
MTTTYQMKAIKNFFDQMEEWHLEWRWSQDFNGRESIPIAEVKNWFSAQRVLGNIQTERMFEIMEAYVVAFVEMGE